MLAFPEKAVLSWPDLASPIFFQEAILKLSSEMTRVKSFICSLSIQLLKDSVGGDFWDVCPGEMQREMDLDGTTIVLDFSAGLPGPWRVRLPSLDVGSSLQLASLG